MELDLHPITLAVCRLAPSAPLPDWAANATAPIVSITRTPTELSIVAPEDAVPVTVRAERGWRALSVRGPLDFSLTGVLAALAGPLADAAIPIFVVSTFDTDWLLVRTGDVDVASAVLEHAGHVVHRVS